MTFKGSCLIPLSRGQEAQDSQQSQAPPHLLPSCPPNEEKTTAVKNGGVAYGCFLMFSSGVAEVL